MGSKWSAYYPDDPRGFQFEEHETFQSDLDKPEHANTLERNDPPASTRARPSFSSASVRAANSAKAKLAKKDPLERIAPNLLSKSDR